MCESLCGRNPVSDGHLRNHLEADWNDVPVEHIDIDSVNEWALKQRKEGLSWTMIKNILRTMQRVLSSSSKDHRPPFSLRGLAIPERDKLQMKIKSRQKVSFSWQQAKLIAAQVKKLQRLCQARKDQYAMLIILASAADTRCSELFALKPNDVDFEADTIRVDESSDQRSNGKIGECKNVAAYRTIVMHDPEGREAMRLLRRFLKKYLSQTRTSLSSVPGATLQFSKRMFCMMACTRLCGHSVCPRADCMPSVAVVTRGGKCLV
jgi:integrase